MHFIPFHVALFFRLAAAASRSLKFFPNWLVAVLCVFNIFSSFVKFSDLRPPQVDSLIFVKWCAICEAAKHQKKYSWNYFAMFCTSRGQTSTWQCCGGVGVFSAVDCRREARHARYY